MRKVPACADVAEEKKRLVSSDALCGGAWRAVILRKRGGRFFARACHYTSSRPKLRVFDEVGDNSAWAVVE